MKNQITFELAEADNISIWQDNVMVLSKIDEDNNWNPDDGALFKGKPSVLRRLAEALSKLADNMERPL